MMSFAAVSHHNHTTSHHIIISIGVTGPGISIKFALAFGLYGPRAADRIIPFFVIVPRCRISSGCRISSTPLRSPPASIAMRATLVWEAETTGVHPIRTAREK